MGVSHAKRQILMHFRDVISMFTQVIIVSSDQEESYADLDHLALYPGGGLILFQSRQDKDKNIYSIHSIVITYMYSKIYIFKDIMG